jgi:hypothetical protein
VSSSSLIRLGGGLASIVSGVLLVVGHLLNLGGDPEYGTVLGESSVIIAHVALVFALVALYAAQAEWSGLPGSTGMVLGVAGTTLDSGVVLVEIAGASGAEVDAVLGAGVSGALSDLVNLFAILERCVTDAATVRRSAVSVAPQPSRSRLLDRS